jgi:hypothetical protein
MPIDPRIALGVQPLQVADPMARYSQLAGIQNAQNQNALAQYQLSTAQREQESVNALNEAYAKSYDATTGKINRNTLRETLARGGFGSKLPGIEKSLTELDKEAALLQKTQGEVSAQPIALAKQQTELLDAKLKQSRAFLDTLNPADPNAPAAYLQWHQANHADPIIGPALKARGVTADKSLAQIQAAVAKGPQAFADLINGSKLGTEKFMELNKPTTATVDQGGQTQMFQTPGLGGKPVSVGTFADVPLPANVLAQKKDIARSGAANISNVQEKAEAQDYGKLLVKDFESVKTQATVAARSLPAIESNLATLDKGFDTGFGTETIAAGAKVLGALGVQKAEDFATDAQTFLASANAAVLQRQLEQKGPQTESDAQRITATGAQLGNTKAANRFVLNVAKAQLQRDVEQRRFYSDWRAANKTLEGAEDAWFAGPGGKSLFDSPTLKKYGTNVVDQIPGQSRAAPAVATTVPQGAIDALKAGKGTDAQFDAVFGAGAAKRVRGGK